MNSKVASGADRVDEPDGPVSGVTLRRCPDCGSARLDVTASWYRADFACQDCGSCWRIQHGLLYKTDPATDSVDQPGVLDGAGRVSAGATGRR